MAKAFPNTGVTIVDTSADLPTPSAALEGVMMFQKDTNELKICDGANWVVVSRTDAMSIDASGRPLSPLRPAFKAYLNTSGNISATSPVVYSQTNFNIGGHYSTASGRFTAPVAGVYFFSVCLNMYGTSSATGSVGIRRYNSSNVAQDRIMGNMFVSSNASDFNFVASGVLYMNASDYARVECTTFGTFSGGQDWNHFMGFLVG